MKRKKIVLIRKNQLLHSPFYVLVPPVTFRNPDPGCTVFILWINQRINVQRVCSNMHGGCSVPPSHRVPSAVRTHWHRSHWRRLLCSSCLWRSAATVLPLGWMLNKLLEQLPFAAMSFELCEIQGICVSLPEIWDGGSPFRDPNVLLKH